MHLITLNTKLRVNLLHYSQFIFKFDWKTTLAKGFLLFSKFKLPYFLYFHLSLNVFNDFLFLFPGECLTITPFFRHCCCCARCTAHRKCSQPDNAISNMRRNHSLWLEVSFFCLFIFFYLKWRYYCEWNGNGKVVVEEGSVIHTIREQMADEAEVESHKVKMRCGKKYGWWKEGRKNQFIWIQK